MDIVEEIRTNRENGARRLEAEYKAGLMTLARRFCHDSGDAEELVNRTFAAVVEGIDDYLEQSAFFAWMCQILTNIHSMDVRRKSNQNEVYPGVVPDIEDEGAQEAIYNNLDASLLREAIRKLPKEMKEVIVMYYLMDQPISRVAKFLSLPVSTVKWRLHCARSELARRLGAKTAEIAKKPGVKATLLVLALCALTAAGAAVAAVIRGGTQDKGVRSSDRDAAILESGGVVPRAAAIGETGETSGSGGYSPVAATPTPVPPDSPAPPVITHSTSSTPSTFSTSLGEQTMNTTTLRTLAASAAFAAATAATSVNASDYTWKASPTDANWNISSLNWTTDGADSVAWTNNVENPNNAIFGASSKKAINIGGNRHIYDLTINNGGYSFSGDFCNLIMYGTILANGNTTFNGKVSSGAADCSLRLASTSSSEVFVYFNSSQNSYTNIYLDGTFVFSPILDGALGPKPATPGANGIFVTGGSPTLFGGSYNNKSFTVNSNRIVRISSGKSLKLASNYTFTLGCPVVADATEGYDYSRNTFVQVRGKSGWEGLIVFDPGAGNTNAFGRLKVLGRGKIAGGVTRVSGPGGATEDTAILYVARSSSPTAFSDTTGNLLVDGGELYASQQVNVNVSDYGQVTVTNFGKVNMPKVDWLNGNSGRARLTVAKDGEFTVNLLRISQSSSLSEVHLNEGGLIEASFLCIDPSGKRNGKFRFNGGRLRSRDANNPFFASTSGTSLAADKAAYVTFAVGENGAVFDTELKNLYWNASLVSDPAAGFANDGGIHKIGGNILILTGTNFYNGVTWIEGGDAQLRVDNALPPGTTLKLSNGGFITAFTFENESPQRSTVQWIGRVEGNGTLKYMTQSHVTNSIAPAVDGTIRFESRCDLRGDYEVVGNASGCSCLEVAAGQDISGLTLKVADFSAFDKNAENGAYTILDAPGGFTGNFQIPAGWPEDWRVRYASDGAFILHRNPLVITFR